MMEDKIVDKDNGSIVERYKVIDVIKGYGICLMVCGHSGAPFTDWIYLFHMALFFIASGYLWNERNAHRPGSGLEPCHHQPQRKKEHTVLYRRIPFALKGRADRSIQRRNLEAVPKMGRYTDRNYAEHQGFAGQPRNRKHLREQRFHLYAQPGIRRPANPCKAAEYFTVPAVVCDEQQRGRGAAVLRQHDYPVQG